MKHAKMLAIAAVAVFCVSAFAIAINVDNSSADGEKLTYSFYLELNNGTDKYSARLADTVVNGATASGATYETALNQAFSAISEATISFGSWNNILSMTIGGHTYTTSDYGSDWGTDHYYSPTVYYFDANKEWKAVSDFSESTMIVIVFDKYAFAEPSDASKYRHDTEMNCWTLLPTVSIVDYKIYYELEDNDGSKFSKWTESTQLGVSPQSLRSARAFGAAAAGFELVNHAKYASSIVSITADGHTYTKHGTEAEDNEWAFAAYFDKGDNTWKDLQSDDMNTATTLCYVFNLNKYTDPNDSTYYHHNAVGSMGEYWTKLPSILPDGSDANKKSNNNLVLYIVIGVVAVVAVAAVAFFLLKKKA